MLHAADVEALGAIKKQVSRCWLLYVFSAADRYMYYMYEFNTHISMNCVLLQLEEFHSKFSTEQEIRIKAEKDLEDAKVTYTQMKSK